MRTWLYNRVKGLVDIPTAFGSGALMRIISSGAADQPNKPFMVLTMGVEGSPPGSVPEMKVQEIPFTIWVHDEPGSMLNIDEAARVLKHGMPLDGGAVVGNMSVYEVRWRETGDDSYDDHYGTNCRPVRFGMVTRG